jgi:putative ABC transport system permease protein
LQKIQNSELVQKQIQNPEQDVILNLPFLPADYTEPTESEKATQISEYFATLSDEKRAEIFTEISATPDENYVNSTIQAQIGSMNRAELEKLVMQSLAEKETEGLDTSYITDYIAQMSDEELMGSIREEMANQIQKQYAESAKANLASIPKEQLSMMLLASLQKGEYSEKELADFYDRFMPPTHSESDYSKNLKLLGVIKKENPTSIHIYTDTFENKDRIADLVKEYNKDKEEDDKIEYTDVSAMMMSGISSIINAISYVLIAFVSISLVVSSIMIGIITYISVLERTKEIGILRAIGASKKDISRVFNAESVIEGFGAGILGIGITLLLTLPINAIIHALTGIMELSAKLPPEGYFLILISIFLSYIAGLIPARFAAKKDPVEALRTE